MARVARVHRVADMAGNGQGGGSCRGDHGSGGGRGGVVARVVEVEKEVGWLKT